MEILRDATRLEEEVVDEIMECSNFGACCLSGFCCQGGGC